MKLSKIKTLDVWKIVELTFVDANGEEKTMEVKVFNGKMTKNIDHLDKEVQKILLDLFPN